MKTDNWISIKSVLPFVFDSIDESLVDEGILYEWCYNAWDKIETHPFTVPRPAFLQVENYKAKLPCDLQKVEMVMYKIDTLAAVADLQDCSNIHDDVHLNWYENNSYATMYQDFYRRKWEVMKKPTGKFQLSFVDCSSDIVNFENSCGRRCAHEYNIIGSANSTYIQTTFKEGIIVVAYRAKLMEGDDYLIPDDTDIKEAIKSYCMMRLWESRWNAKEEGSGERFKYYSLEWALKKAIVQGKYKMPDLDEMEQIRIQQTKMIQSVGQFDSHFANLASPELANLLNLH
jgi:hypothetical protein